jgi:hypothetical protein
LDLGLFLPSRREFARSRKISLVNCQVFQRLQGSANPKPKFQPGKLEKPVPNKKKNLTINSSGIPIANPFSAKFSVLIPPGVVERPVGAVRDRKGPVFGVIREFSAVFYFAVFPEFATEVFPGIYQVFTEEPNVLWHDSPEVCEVRIGVI